MTERAEVPAAPIVRDEGRGVGAVDRFLDHTKQEGAGQPLRQTDQRGVRGLRRDRVLQQDAGLAAARGEAAQRGQDFGPVEQARVELAAVDP